MPKQVGPGAKAFGPVVTRPERYDWMVPVGFVVLCVLIAIFSPWNTDKADAQTFPPPAGLQCSFPSQVALSINGGADNVQPQPGDVITVEWSQFGNRSEPLPKTLTLGPGSGLCTFDIAFYTHGDNQVLRPHPNSTLVTSSEDNPVTILHNEHVLGNPNLPIIWQRFQVTLTIPQYDAACTEGTQIDVYRDSSPTQAGPIPDFDTNDDGVIDRTYSGEFRLVDAFNWESPEELCIPTTTTSPSTTVPDTTTTTEASTTTTEAPTTTTTPVESTTTVAAANDTTSTTTPTSSIADPTTSTIGDPVTMSSLPRTGSSTTQIGLAIATTLIAAGMTLIGIERRRFSQ